MRWMTGFSRLGLLAVFVMLLGFAAGGPALAEDAAEPAWQTAITGQIEAFRAGDGAAALSFAGAGFREAYSDGDKFIIDIAASGYVAIVTSRSHSFGEFSQVSDTAVAQIVHIVGADQKRYEALYQMTLEDGAWHVQGVALKLDPGIAI